MGQKKHEGYARRGAGQWTHLVAEQAESGLSQKAFCSERGLGYSSFCNWKRRLAQSGASPAGDSGFVEVTLQPGRTVLWDVELTLGAGVVLRVRRR